MKKILITGANSYIGTSFEEYIKKNYPNEYMVDTADMIDGSWREKDFSGYDSVFHVAGIAHQKETEENAHLYYEVNCNLVVETAEKAKNEGGNHFIFLSTMSVYGVETGVVTKDTSLAPKSHYGKSKLQAEKMLGEMKSESFKIAIVRPPMVYGKGCKGNYNLLKKIAMKSPVFPDVKNERSMIYILNLCEFIKLLSDNREEGLFFPQNSEYVNTTELAREICLCNGKTIKTTKFFNWLFPLVRLVTNKADKAFGTLIYEKTITDYKANYSLVGFADSVKYTEVGE